eukprot:CAMPEP_0119380416 /NCGR_PEP_ID=MMETSP1334-20130426/56877_1 /TAXON_ID=127549 /ORGANISM="Calcidiscus leptoporus, Strain RCC1130" /LENGTH=129 /DNA_ID=CAMNT_0007400235 /DNA_START=417 /DNA_END=807 /DNA_ORIENTATION=+
MTTACQAGTNSGSQSSERKRGVPRGEALAPFENRGDITSAAALNRPAASEEVGSKPSNAIFHDAHERQGESERRSQAKKGLVEIMRAPPEQLRAQDARGGQRGTEHPQAVRGHLLLVLWGVRVRNRRVA